LIGRIDIITPFPDMVAGVLKTSILGRAVTKGLMDFRLYNLYEFADPPHLVTPPTEHRVLTASRNIHAPRQRLERGLAPTGGVKSVRKGDVSDLPIGQNLGRRPVMLDGLRGSVASLLEPTDQEVGDVVENVALVEFECPL